MSCPTLGIGPLDLIDKETYCITEILKLSHLIDGHVHGREFFNVQSCYESMFSAWKNTGRSLQGVQWLLTMILWNSAMPRGLGLEWHSESDTKCNRFIVSNRLAT